MSRHLALDRSLRIAACLGAILAAGCGGGGGGEAPPPELLQITTQNQVAVARATAANFLSLGAVGDLPISGSASTAKARAMAGLTKHALGAAVTAARAADGKVAPFAVYTETEDCPYGGSLTISLDDRNNDGTPSAGDVLTMTFNDCRASASSSTKGSVSINIAGFSQTQLSGLFTFSQLETSDDGYTSAVNGAANCLYTETVDMLGTRTVIDMTVATAGLVGRASTPGYSETFTYDPGFRALWTDVMPSASSAAPYSTSALNGKVLVASLGGRMILTTDATAPVHDWWSEPYPDSGKVMVDGYKSHLRLTVLNTVTVRLELDANDDGAMESSLDIPWTTLMP